MKIDHAFHDPAGGPELTAEAIETYMRRAHLERARAMHDLLLRARARIAGWFRRDSARALPPGCTA